MTSETRPAVVAGYDGSPESNAALTLAAEHAVRSQHRLRVVCGVLWPLILPVLDPAAGHEAIDGVKARLHEAIKPLRHRHPELEIVAEVIMGGPAGILVHESKRASLVVVGSRGRGGFTSLLAGSVATQLAAHAHCPVIVDRRPTDNTSAGPIVVGIDAHSGCTPAVEFAFAEASSRGVPLTALHVWSEAPHTKPAHRTSSFDEAQQDADRVLEETVAGFSEKFPDVTVERALRFGMDPARALIRTSKDAGLLVVGSRGRGGFSGLLLGSVSQALVHHADCPVAVVHADARPS